MHLTKSFVPRGVRYPAPDVARGFMLLLIALANVSVWAATVRSGSPGSAADTAWIWVRTLLVTSRAYPLFAMLFGFGLTVMINRRIASGTRAHLQRLGAAGAGREPTPAEEAWAREQATVDARRLVRRRGLWMILFGFVHGIFFYGDIIGTYGLAAVVFAGWLARNHRKRALAVCVLLTLILIWTQLNAGGAAAIMGTTYAQAVAQEQVRAEGLSVFFSNVQRWTAQSVTILGVASTIVPAMFIGARLADTDVMADPRKHRGPLVAVAVGGLVIGAASAVGMARWIAGGRLMAWDPVVDEVFGLAGACGWLALLTLCAGGPAPDGRLTGLRRLASSVGRRSMTGYLSQTILFATVFVIVPRLLGTHLVVGEAASAGIAVVVWLAAVVLCAVLERGGHAGPFEALLRTAVARTERRRRLPAPPAPQPVRLGRHVGAEPALRGDEDQRPQQHEQPEGERRGLLEDLRVLPGRLDRRGDDGEVLRRDDLAQAAAGQVLTTHDREEAGADPTATAPRLHDIAEGGDGHMRVSPGRVLAKEKEQPKKPVE